MMSSTISAHVLHYCWLFEMTPEDYLIAVKSYPRVVERGSYGFLYHGYAIRREGDRVAVIPDFLGKDNLRAFAERSTPDHLYASSGCWNHVGRVLYGELPSKEQLRDYFVSRHGKLGGLNRLFPSRIDRPATVEWFEEQLAKGGQQEEGTTGTRSMGALLLHVRRAPR